MVYFFKYFVEEVGSQPRPPIIVVISAWIITLYRLYWLLPLLTLFDRIFYLRRNPTAHHHLGTMAVLPKKNWGLTSARIQYRWLIGSLLDPYHFDADPLPGWWIRPKIEQIPISFFLTFFCIRFKTHNDVFLL